MSGPKMLEVLRTRWPDVQLSLLDAAGKAVPLGSEEAASLKMPQT